MACPGKCEALLKQEKDPAGLGRLYVVSTAPVRKSWGEVWSAGTHHWQCTGCNSESCTDTPPPKPVKRARYWTDTKTDCSVSGGEEFALVDGEIVEMDNRADGRPAPTVAELTAETERILRRLRADELRDLGFSEDFIRWRLARG